MIKKIIMKKFSLAWAIFFVLAFVITASPAKIAKATAGTMEAHIIDVGQGDSILIKLPDGKNMLIDGGPGSAEPTVVSYIQGQGISTLDYVVETHPHEDHIGGLDGVINTFSIGKVYIPNATATTQAYTNLMNAISAKGLSPIATHAGVIIFDTTYNAKILKAVMVAPIDNSYTNVNDYSAVIRITYGTESWLFTGDASEYSEAEILAAGGALQADVLKVGHHGSATSSTAAFLTAVSPKSAVISVGAGNTYGHPTQECIDRLKAVNTDILRTDLNGTVVYTTTGTGFTCNKTPWWVGSGGGGITTSINEGFNTVVGTSTSITSGIPTGWTFSSGLAVYTSSGYYGLSAPSIKFQTTGNQMTTPNFTLSAAATLSFWLKGASTDANSHLLVEKYDGSTWSTVADIKPIPTTGTTKSYSLTTSYKQVRFTYTKSVGNIGIDDVKIQ